MRITYALLLLALTTSCVAPAPPAPRPVSERPVAPPRPLAPRPLAGDWRDWPLTSGDWEYRRYDGRSSATFGQGGDARLVVSCADREVRIAWPGAAAAPFTVRTSTASRQLATAPLGDPPAGQAARLAATDPLLDAIAFSRGRWTVEQQGRPPLVLPAYAEVARVVEDCRG